MLPPGRLKQLVLFVGLYLLLSLPPYAALNPDVVTGVVRRSLPPGPFVAALLVGAAAVVGAGLVRGSAGVERYVRFLLSPTDWLSVLVALSFVLAAVSWWAVPELVLRYVGRVDLGVLYFLVFLAHSPMLLFLSLLTAAGFTQGE
ncbi:MULTISPECIES: hypothetical protein [Salinibaculum]|uniref:hypothetical protein n=1 Tax=Salinibaculum TaxID=2732368 RepID=UPI0030CDAC4F